MRIIKKNQVIVYTIALMLVAAGYLNYTSTGDLSSAIQTSASEEELAQVANIGDAQLVSSNDVKAEENTGNNTQNTSTKESYFTTSKLERDKMYSQMLETYNNVLNSNNALETQKQSATAEITKINNVKNSIMISENLISTKGFEDCVIFVNGDSINVVVRSDGLTKEEVSQIQNVISREMSTKVENIHISNK